jgi:hypothetical protein
LEVNMGVGFFTQLFQQFVVGGKSSGDGRTTAGVDGNEGPADATNDNTQ